MKKTLLFYTILLLSSWSTNAQHPLDIAQSQLQRALEQGDKSQIHEAMLKHQALLYQLAQPQNLLLNLYKTDSIEARGWDASSQSWGATNSKLYNTYNCEKEQLLETRSVSVNGSTFSNNFKIEFSYHPTGELKSTKNYNFGLGNWVQYSEYEYLPSGAYAGYWVYTQTSNGNPLAGIKYVYTYDGAENLILEEQFEYSTSLSNWLPTLKFTSTFDSGNKIVSSQKEVFLSGIWFESSQTLYTYDNAGRLIEELTRESFGTVLQDRIRLIYSYIAGNKPSTILRQENVAGLWFPKKRFTLSYDANENLTQQLSEFSVNNNDWQQDSLQTHTYHADNSRAGNHRAFWNGNNNSWVEYSIDSADVNGNQVLLISKYGYNPVDNSFQGGVRFVNTWYANQLESSLRDYLNAGTFDTWTPSQKDFYTFDANNLQLQGTIQFWNPSTNEFVNTNQNNFFNSNCLVGSTNTPTATAQQPVCRMANPYLPGQLVQCDEMLTPGAQATVELFDMAGRLTQRQAISANTFSLHGSIAPGMYTLVVKSTDSVLFRSKIVVQQP